MDDGRKNDNFAFIKEKIKDRPLDRRQMLIKLLQLLIGGLVFGLAACLAFVATRPALERAFYGDQAIIIPEDPPPDEEDNGVAGEGEEPPPEVVQEIVLPLEPEDYQALKDKLYAIGKEAAKAIVTVTAVTTEPDLFDTSFENEHSGVGIIIANSDTELLILTDRSLIANDSEIRVSFAGGEAVPASLRQSDGNTGLAVISTSMSMVPVESLPKIETASLGNSLGVSLGDVVIAIEGSVGSNAPILAGTITSVGNQISAWDGNYTIFTTDMVGSAQGNGALINLEGEIIGLIAPDFAGEHLKHMITALSVSELKPVIEHLSNGEAFPYLGLQVGTVTTDIEQKHQIPKGVYIREVAANSPAMRAGLQNADVIVELNGEEVQTVRRYTQLLQAMRPEQQVQVKVMRQSGTGYIPLVYTATLGVLE